MPAQAAHFSRSARSALLASLVSTPPCGRLVSTLRAIQALASQHFGFLFVERLMVRCVWGPQASENLLWPGPHARWLRIIYEFRDDTELEGSTLIGTGPDVYTKKVGVLFILIALLATYAAGMAAPLFLMALLWDRLDLGHRRWLRGREISLGSLRLHTTNLLSGPMFVAIGVLFIISEGTSSLEGLYASGGPTDLAFSVERWAQSFGVGTPVSVVFAGLGLLFAGLLVYRLARRRKKKPVERGGKTAPMELLLPGRFEDSATAYGYVR